MTQSKKTQASSPKKRRSSRGVLKIGRKSSPTNRAPELSNPAFLRFIEGCPHLVIAANKSGRILYANSYAQKITGYPEEEFRSAGFDFANAIAPEDRAIARKNTSMFWKGKKVQPHEMRLLTQDGEIIHVHVALQHVLLHGEKTMMCVMTNISAHWHQDMQITAQRDRLQFYLDATPIFTAVLDRHGAIVNVNQTAAEALGYPKSVIIGKNWFDFCVPPDTRAERKAYFADVMAEKKPVQVLQQRDILVNGGRRKQMLWYYTVIRDAKGQPFTGCITCGFDIDQEQSLRHNLEISEEKYRDLFINSQMGIYRSTPKGHLLLANPALIKMLRYSSFEEISRIDLEKTGYYRDFPRSLFINAIEKTGSVHGFEAKWRTKDGDPLHIRENAKAVRDTNGKTIYYEGTIEDITAQVVAKTALERQILFEKLINGISIRFMNLAPHELDHGIRSTLEELGRFMEVDRSYVFQYHDDDKKMSNTHEWTSEGTAIQQKKLQNIDTSSFKWFSSRITRNEVVHVPRVQDLPSEASAEKSEFAEEGIKSLINVPLVCGAKVLGFVGFDSVSCEKSWNDTTISLLRIVGVILASALERRREEEELLYRSRFEQLIASTSTEFVNLAPSEIDSAINRAIEKICAFCLADYGVMYRFCNGEKSMQCTHAWNRGASSMSPQTSVPTPDISCIKMLRAGEPFTLTLNNQPGPEFSAEMDYMKKNGFKAAMAMPFTSSDERGFLGFATRSDEQSWSDDTLSLLKVLAEIFSNALERKKAEEDLMLRFELGEVIASVSAKLVNLHPEHVDDAIRNALVDIMDLMKADNVALGQLAEDNNGLMQSISNWTATEICRIPEYANVPTTDLPWSLQRILRMELMEIPCDDDLPPDAAHEKKVMQDYGIGAAILVPFVFDKTSKGFAAFSYLKEQPKRSKDVISLFKIMGEMLTSALELKATARSLAKERQLFKALMDTIPDHIYFKDKQCKIINANRALSEQHRIKSGEVIGKTDFELFTEEHAQQAFDDEQEIMRTGIPIVGKEEKETWADGRVTWASTTKVPLYDENGKIIGTFGVSRDITERKQTEEERRKMEAQMQHTQKLESIGVLSGGIAHDFNNLLMGILGNTGLALMQLTPESPVWSQIKQIETVSLRAAELTNQMLAYSGKSKFIVKPLNLSVLVREMSHLLEVSISKKIKLVYNFAEDIPLVDGDASQLRQVVMNLITNASDAIGNKKGQITVATGCMDCSASYLSTCYIAGKAQPGRYTYFEVADTGCGMDAKTLERIFDPFFTTKIKGRGLGLAAALGIIKSHKGTLRVYTESGKGTNFKVLFQISAEQLKQVEVVSSESSSWKMKGTVLVVDDDDIIRAVTEQMLKSFGLEVTTAEDGRAAIRKCQIDKHRLTCILLDVSLPDTSTKELLDEIRAVVGETPIVLFSGYNEQTATTDLKPGCYDGFIQKPFTAEALGQTLKDVLTNPPKA